MANEEHLARLRQGVAAWNQWREENRTIELDLSGARLIRADLSGVHLAGAHLNGAILSGVHLAGAHLNGAILSEAILHRADLSEAHLAGAHLCEANLFKARLSNTNLSKADLSRARLEHAVLIETDLKEATLTDCKVYGISTWAVQLEGAHQANLVITRFKQPTVTVDNLEVAQFIYLLLHNEKIRHVIDTITSKAVLILGRFTPERKAVLDAIREALRQWNYLPILFDFEAPGSRDLTETISLGTYGAVHHRRSYRA
jgi:Pentapeptide repeats (8 copies)